MSEKAESFALSLSGAELEAIGECVHVDLRGLLLAEAEADRSAASDDGQRSLAERGLATVTSGTLALEPELGAVVDVLRGPGLLAEIVSAEIGSRARLLLLALPQLALRCQVVQYGIRIEPFQTEEFLVAVLDACSLVDRPLPTWGVLSIPGDLAADLDLSSVPCVLPAAIDAALLDRGVPPDSVHGVIDALPGIVRSCAVTIAHRPSEHVVAGGELHWLDADDHGLLVLEEDDTEATLADAAGGLRVVPSSALDIATELFSYLPDAPSSSSSR